MRFYEIIADKPAHPSYEEITQVLEDEFDENRSDEINLKEFYPKDGNKFTIGVESRHTEADYYFVVFYSDEGLKMTVDGKEKLFKWNGSAEDMAYSVLSHIESAVEDADNEFDEDEDEDEDEDN